MSFLNTKLHIVSGKGGVGKTTVAICKGLQLGALGKKTLIAEMGGQPDIPDILGLPASTEEMQEIQPNVWLTHLTPEKAMRQYIQQTLRFEFLSRVIFENRFVQHFLQLIPALAELVILGKIWFHLSEKHFDCIVLDAPSTGHALALLRSAEVVEKTVTQGPLHHNAKRIAQMLAAKTTSLTIVSTPEEMAVVEALTLYNAPLQKSNLVMNCWPKQLPEDLPLQTLSQEWQTELNWRLEKQQREHHLLKKFPKQWLDEAIFLPYVTNIYDLKAYFHV